MAMVAEVRRGKVRLGPRVSDAEGRLGSATGVSRPWIRKSLLCDVGAGQKSSSKTARAWQCLVKRLGRAPLCVRQWWLRVNRVRGNSGGNDKLSGVDTFWEYHTAGRDVVWVKRDLAAEAGGKNRGKYSVLRARTPGPTPRFI